MWSKRKHLVPGLVVWILSDDNSPSWPAVIKDANSSPPSRTHRTVRLFGERESEGDVSMHMQHLEDYTILPRDGDEEAEEDPKLAAACDLAEQYLKEKGFEEQRKALSSERSPMETAALARIYPRKSNGSKSTSSPPKRITRSSLFSSPPPTPQREGDDDNADNDNANNDDAEIDDEDEDDDEPPVCLKLQIRPSSAEQSDENPVSEPEQSPVPLASPNDMNIRGAPWLSGDVPGTLEELSPETVANPNPPVAPTNATATATTKRSKKSADTLRSGKRRAAASTGIAKRRRSGPRAEAGPSEIPEKRPPSAAASQKKTVVDLAAITERIGGETFTQLAVQLRKTKAAEEMLCARMAEVAEIRDTAQTLEDLRAEIASQTRRRDVLENAVRMVQSVFDDLQADLREFTRERDAASAELDTLRERIQRNRKLIAEQEATRAAFAKDLPSLMGDSVINKK